MPRIIKPLVVSQIETAKPKEKPYKLFDGGGLYIQINPCGTKNWYFTYRRPFLKKPNTIALGPYPYVSLMDARKVREEYREDVVKNVDPQEKKKAIEKEAVDRANMTFESIYNLWCVEKKVNVKPTTFRGYECIYNRHVKQKLGQMPIEEITIPIVLETLNVLNGERKSRHLVRVMNFIYQVVAFATIIGKIKYNPLADISKVPIYYTDIEHRLTISPSELPAFLDKLFKTEYFIVFKMALLWQLLTMVRPSEAIAAEWCEIDLDEKVWHIPAEKMKGKKGKKRDHVVPLSTQAIALLNAIREFTGQTQFVFPSTRFKVRGAGKPISSNTVLKVIYEVNYKDKLTAHGLRSIASTYLNDVGADGDVIEACLAHMVGNTVRNAYNRSTFFERRKPVMQQWGDYVEECAGGNIIEKLYLTINK